ncbi:MAG: bifunctional phosphopantothenoylcysteine decarboxylase/phosphopantothenate--cysteine ligase CoaBC [Chitinispirillia bacterium]|nr:bifunctional phosphopantothenoylcysteine decarboxylase/phosphopantothenate--cysteine ligase CoaBC [Chitinispirillia bacterium]
MQKILIGISGGIGAYKIPLLVRLLRKKKCEVKVVLTPAACPLVGAEALAALSGSPVYLDEQSNYDMDHIRLAEWADIFVIAPATANTIAKIAAGIGDNLLTTLALSIPEEKIMTAPAMNTVMWESKATQANILSLNARGISVLNVGCGELACGTSGPGRMLEVDEIAEHIFTRLGVCDLLKGKRVLISSGPTEEPIDPVRVITNKSSGKMGAALAEAALLMGAQNVTVVSGPAAHPLPVRAEVIHVKSALEMRDALAEKFGSSDICIMAAAVSDYRPVSFSKEKLHRCEDEKLTLELVPNPDILAELGASKSNQYVAGFSLESGDDVSRAESKMRRKNCDMMIFNKADDTLGKDSTAFTILFKNGRNPEQFAMMDKSQAAVLILKNIAQSMGLR